MSVNAEKPLVCVCIPTFNSAATIRETLASIVNQSYKHLNIHVVDNDSTDDTLQIVLEFNDPRIRLYKNKINVGAEGNFNRCIQSATGEYTAIFHADDIYESAMVEKQVLLLEDNPEVGAVFTEAKLIDENSEIIGKIRFPRDLNSPGNIYSFKEIFKAVLKHSNFLICPSVMTRTAIYQQEVKSWRGEMFQSSADLDVWLRIAQHHQVAFLARPLMRYRISKKQFSAKVRLQTERADFFRVMDFYLAKGEVCALLEPSDIQNYEHLCRRDRVMRAVNLFLLGRVDGVRDLIRDSYTWDVLKAGFQSKRNGAILLAGFYLRLLLLLRLNRFGQVSLGFIKRALRK